jgi:hypothetical protein
MRTTSRDPERTRELLLQAAFHVMYAMREVEKES